MLLTNIIVTAICSINVLVKSSKMIFFIFSFLYGTSMFGISIIIVALFPKKRSSATGAAIFFFLTYFLTFAINNPSITKVPRILLSFIPNIGMTYAIGTFYHLEMQGNGLMLSTLNAPYNHFSFLDGVIMMIVDIFLYTLLGLYLDQVVASDFGVSQKWNFCCKRDFWCRRT